MTTVTITTFEDIHHVCLMYGLKQAYRRYPFLVHNIMATPPPFRRNPARSRIFIGSRLNPVNVHYFKKEISIIYDEGRVPDSDIHAFAAAVVEEYLRLRHPYMAYEWNDRKMTEPSSGHLIAEII